MKLGLGLYRGLLTDDNFRFARQAGCTHIVAHLTNYFAGANPDLSSGDDEGWGSCEGAPLWSQDELDDRTEGEHDRQLTKSDGARPAGPPGRPGPPRRLTRRRGASAACAFVTAVRVGFRESFAPPPTLALPPRRASCGGVRCRPAYRGPTFLL